MAIEICRSVPGAFRRAQPQELPRRARFQLEWAQCGGAYKAKQRKNDNCKNTGKCKQHFTGYKEFDLHNY